MKKKQIGIIVIIFAIVVVAVFGGLYLTRNIGKSQKAISKEEAGTKLTKMINKIEPKKGTEYKSSVEFADKDNTADELPDIKSCDVNVKASTDLYAEIYSSPEKAGTGTDSWLCEAAKDFNSKGYTVNGKKVSVQIRNVNSGQAVDYITSGKAVPDGFTPSSMFWVSMLNMDGVKTEVVSDSLVKNVAGIVLKNDVYKKMIDKYGSIDMKSITEATESGEISMGYTNPFASTAGLNFLACTLQRYDSKNPLSDTAIEGFGKFQNNVPFVALTTMQMRTAADKGTFDGFILEHQSYVNDAKLSKNYKFTAYGYRHDNPLVSISTASSDKKEILKLFANHCASDSVQKMAAKDGFNGMNKYKCEYPELDGNTLSSMQQLYKENKDSERPVIGIFITDVSGSMGGDSINALKTSLLNSMKYISPNNYIGLISYNDDVTIEVPLAKFDLNQQSLFKGSVEHLDANGGTATFDAICVGLNMIQEQLKQTPDAKPMLFVLSDGETNSGYGLNDIKNVVSGLKVPIYTIGYNADLDALQKISDINEAASINSDTDDIIYQLKQLFNAEM